MSKITNDRQYTIPGTKHTIKPKEIPSFTKDKLPAEVSKELQSITTVLLNIITDIYNANEVLLKQATKLANLSTDPNYNVSTKVKTKVIPHTVPNPNTKP